MRTSKSLCLSMLLGALAFVVPCVSAQISLGSAVDLALRNSPKVKMAQADLDKARATLAETHDAYIPAIAATGGYGASTGVPRELPVIFSMSAQSLAFNYQQKDYVRAATAGVTAATFALDEVRNQVAEDTVTTYISLNSALQRRTALTQGGEFAERLVKIVQDRFDSGIEPHIEVTRSHRTAIQLRLQKLLVDDEIASLADHMAKLTGVTASNTETVPDSIPAFTPPAQAPLGAAAISPGIQALEATGIAKGFTAHGDSRYRLRPQVGFSAGYSRITTTGTDYGDYYPRFANGAYSHNSFDIGIQVTLPILDLVHQARARGSAAEAARARFDAESQRLQFLEGRLKLQHSAAELSARAEIASLDRDLAQDQLDAIEIQLKAGSGNPEGPQMTPKDEQNARLQERQKYLEYLDAELQLRQTEISLMRQAGTLGEWLHSTISTPPAPAPPAASVVPEAPTVPATPAPQP